MPKPPVPYGDQPAFPCDVGVEFRDDGAEANRCGPHRAGLTVRDWLAGQALSGMAALALPAASAVKMAYEYADAMLAAREQK